MRRFYLIAFLWAICIGACSKEPIILPSSPEIEYIAVFGDIQYLTEMDNRVKYYSESINWIKFQNEVGVPFKCVLQTGDITQSNSPAQYERFWNATKDLASIIPYYAIIGDHDYAWKPKIESRDSTLFSNYLCFPNTLNHIVDSFEDGRLENVIYFNEVFGERIDIIAIEFGPRDEVLDWVDSHVNNHPDRKYVLMTHEYLEAGGGRRVDDLKSVMRLKNTTFNTPEQIWNKIVKCNNNIMCVLCGHVGGLFAVSFEVNDFGREVPQIQHNIQSPEYRFDSWLMLWQFPKLSDSANVFIINTDSGKFYQDGVLFTFQYKY